MSLVFNGDGRTIRITKEINVISGIEKKGFLTQRDRVGADSNAMDGSTQVCFVNAFLWVMQENQTGSSVWRQSACIRTHQVKSLGTDKQQSSQSSSTSSFSIF